MITFSTFFLSLWLLDFLFLWKHHSWGSDVYLLEICGNRWTKPQVKGLCKGTLLEIHLVFLCNGSTFDTTTLTCRCFIELVIRRVFFLVWKTYGYDYDNTKMSCLYCLHNSGLQNEATMFLLSNLRGYAWIVSYSIIYKYRNVFPGHIVDDNCRTTAQKMWCRIRNGITLIIDVPIFSPQTIESLY